MVEMAYSNPACQTYPTHYSSSNPNPPPLPGKPALLANYRAANYLHSPYKFPHSLKGKNPHISSRNPAGAHVKTKPSSRKLQASTVVNKPGGSHSSSQGTSMWSTPHAPRQKQPVAPNIAVQVPVVRGVAGTTSDGRSGRDGVRKYPSTHALLKRHNYLDGARFASVLTQMSLEKPKAEEGEGGGHMEWKGGMMREAWQCEEAVDETTCRRLVKPFRRTAGREPPEGVPLLDLHRLNEPDDLMEPVEVIASDSPLRDTQRSDISWGMPRHLTRPSGATVKGEEEAMVVQEVIEEPEDQDLGVVDEGEVPRLDASRFDFVEQKVLSHERSKPAPLSSPIDAMSVSLCGPGAAPRLAPGVFKSHVTLGMGMSEAALSRRLRFAARVLTQNGRDVHRDLCGFCFLADGSLTVYEFRQFGKKSSALPFIHRGSYAHLFGRRRGQPYEIRDIRKGATLHFDTSAHPSLPETLASRATLAIRITHVDEMAKRDLLCEGKNPMECRAVETYLSQPLSPQDKENCLLQTLQGMFRSRLRGRGSKTLVGLGRHLWKVCDPATRTVSCTQLQQALRAFHISLTQEDFSQLWHLLSTGYHPPAAMLGSEGVDVESCVGALVGEMDEDRKTLVRKIFQKLDSHKSGRILMSEMHKFFNATLHPDVLAGRSTAEEVWFGMFGYLETRKQGIIDYADFENFYEGISIETKSDADYFTLLRNCWTI